MQKDYLLTALDGNIESTSDRTKSKSLLKFQIKVRRLPLKCRIYLREMVEKMPFEEVMRITKIIIELETAFGVVKNRLNPKGHQNYREMIKLVKTFGMTQKGFKN